MLAEGRVSVQDGRKVMFNPRYELRPGGGDVSEVDDARDEPSETRWPTDAGGTAGARHGRGRRSEPVAKALGGVRGIVEAAVPTVAFTVTWITTEDLQASR